MIPYVGMWPWLRKGYLKTPRFGKKESKNRWSLRCWRFFGSQSHRSSRAFVAQGISEIVLLLWTCESHGLRCFSRGASAASRSQPQCPWACGGDARYRKTTHPKPLSSRGLGWEVGWGGLRHVSIGLGLKHPLLVLELCQAGQGRDLNKMRSRHQRRHHTSPPDAFRRLQLRRWMYWLNVFVDSLVPEWPLLYLRLLDATATCRVGSNQGCQARLWMVAMRSIWTHPWWNTRVTIGEEQQALRLFLFRPRNFSVTWSPFFSHTQTGHVYLYHLVPTNVL